MKVQLKKGENETRVSVGNFSQEFAPGKTYDVPDAVGEWLLDRQFEKAEEKSASSKTSKPKAAKANANAVKSKTTAPATSQSVPSSANSMTPGDESPAEDLNVSEDK